MVAEPGRLSWGSIRLKEFPKAGVLRMILSAGTPRPVTTSMRASWKYWGERTERTDWTAAS